MVQSVLACVAVGLLLAGVLGQFSEEYGPVSDQVSWAMVAAGVLMLLYLLWFFLYFSNKVDGEKRTLRSSRNNEWDNGLPDKDGNAMESSVTRGVFDETKPPEHHHGYIDPFNPNGL